MNEKQQKLKQLQLNLCKLFPSIRIFDEISSNKILEKFNSPEIPAHKHSELITNFIIKRVLQLCDSLTLNNFMIIYVEIEYYLNKKIERFKVLNNSFIQNLKEIDQKINIFNQVNRDCPIPCEYCKKPFQMKNCLNPYMHKSNITGYNCDICRCNYVKGQKGFHCFDCEKNYDVCLNCSNSQILGIDKIEARMLGDNQENNFYIEYIEIKNMDTLCNQKFNTINNQWRQKIYFYEQNPQYCYANNYQIEGEKLVEKNYYEPYVIIMLGDQYFSTAPKQDDLKYYIGYNFEIKNTLQNLSIRVCDIKTTNIQPKKKFIYFEKEVPLEKLNFVGTSVTRIMEKSNNQDELQVQLKQGFYINIKYKIKINNPNKIKNDLKYKGTIIQDKLDNKIREIKNNEHQLNILQSFIKRDMCINKNKGAPIDTLVNTIQNYQFAVEQDLNSPLQPKKQLSLESVNYNMTFQQQNYFEQKTHQQETSSNILNRSPVYSNYYTARDNLDSQRSNLQTVNGVQTDRNIRHVLHIDSRGSKQNKIDYYQQTQKFRPKGDKNLFCHTDLHLLQSPPNRIAKKNKSKQNLFTSPRKEKQKQQTLVQVEMLKNKNSQKLLVQQQQNQLRNSQIQHSNIQNNNSNFNFSQEISNSDTGGENQSSKEGFLSSDHVLQSPRIKIGDQELLVQTGQLLNNDQQNNGQPQQQQEEQEPLIARYYAGIESSQIDGNDDEEDDFLKFPGLKIKFFLEDDTLCALYYEVKICQEIDSDSEVESNSSEMLSVDNQYNNNDLYMQQMMGQQMNDKMNFIVSPRSMGQSNQFMQSKQYSQQQSNFASENDMKILQRLSSINNGQMQEESQQILLSANGQDKSRMSLMKMYIQQFHQQMNESNREANNNVIQRGERKKTVTLNLNPRTSRQLEKIEKKNSRIEDDYESDSHSQGSTSQNDKKESDSSEKQQNYEEGDEESQSKSSQNKKQKDKLDKNWMQLETVLVLDGQIQQDYYVKNSTEGESLVNKMNKPLKIEKGFHSLHIYYNLKSHKGHRTNLMNYSRKTNPYNLQFEIYDEQSQLKILT